LPGKFFNIFPLVKLSPTNPSLLSEKNFLIQDVYNADEAFVTGTFAGVIPVIEIDGRIMCKGYFTKELQQLYANDINNLS